MRAKYHLLILLICIGIFTYEWIVYNDILTHPYMVGLFITVGLVGYWNFVMLMVKIIFNKDKLL